MPDFLRENLGVVMGCDEAGRGPLAGPVVAAAVFIPLEHRKQNFWLEINDSKKLSAPKREQLFDLIKNHSVFGIGQSSALEIDEINILNATLLAMKRAVRNCTRDFNLTPDLILIDGNRAPTLPHKTETLVKGDTLSISIAAASILAKVTRDRMMAELDRQYPNYGFAQHAGYGTEKHLEALTRLGPCPAHRQSFAPMRNSKAA